MHTLNLRLIFLCAALVCGLCQAQVDNIEPREWLLSQVRLGEALHRDDLVQDSLTRLYKISPNDELGLEAELRLALRHDDLAAARRLLDQLRRQAPDSPAYRRAQLLVTLQEPEKSKALQQARLLALAGRLDQAMAAYDELLHHSLPTPELALEYWKLRSRMKNGSRQALAELLKLDQQYPRNIALRQTLVNLLFAADRDDDAIALLHALAAEPAARNTAAQREFEYIASLPPADTTAGRWDAFMQLYADTPVYARARLAQAGVRALLDDPVWQLGQRGIDLVEQGKNQDAETALMRALEKYPDDANLIGGLGKVYMRTKRREQALSFFKLARDKEPDSYHSQKWVDLAAATRKWLTLEQADKAAGSSNWGDAQRLYQQVHQQDGRNVQAILGLGDAATNLGSPVQAENYYRQALQLDPGNNAAVRRLVQIYQHESPVRALAFLDSLPIESRRPFESQRTQLQLDNLKEQGDQAIARKNFDKAAKLLAQAQTLAPDDVWLTYHLAKAEQERGQPARAQAAFSRLLDRQGGNPAARYAHALLLSSLDKGEQALATLHAIPTGLWDSDMRALAQRLETARIKTLVDDYEKESPAKALAFLSSLSATQLKPFAALRDRLEADSLKTQSDAAIKDKNPALAVALLQRAQALQPDDIWLVYHLANAYQDQGEFALADNAFNHLLKRQGTNPEARYAHALFLSSRGQKVQALASLHVVNTASWSANMRELARKLELEQKMEKAMSLRDAGNESAAIALLSLLPRSNTIDRRLADWAVQRNDYRKAHALYTDMLARQPNDADARLDEIELWLDEGKVDQARDTLETWPIAIEPGDVNARRRQANAWAAVGDLARARALMSRLVSSQASPDALLLRDAARLMRDEQPQQALALYTRAMRVNGLIDNDVSLGSDMDALTLATRVNDHDDWLRRSLRRDAETLYQQQNPVIHFHNEFWGRNDGTPGLSNLTAVTTIVQVDMPLKNGRAFVRAEHVAMDAGKFDTGADNRYDAYFGTCALQACSSSESQRARGTGVAIGWANDTFSADIGTTPVGFKVVDIVGGVTYKGKVKSLGWSATLSRRAMSNSILSYGGMTDPNTGITWGGVRATGASLGLSWDEGGADGVWASLSYHHLTGRNVADNDRVRAMAGYYHRLLDTANRQLTVGVNTMLWHYSKDLGGYTLGQGGYYSPQRYFSVSLPVQYAQRNDAWSYRLNASVSWSHSHTGASNDYPLAQLLPAALSAGRNETSAAGSGSGFGYTAGAQVERRISKHVVLGAAVDIQRANDYSPSRAMLYLRYSFEPWNGNLPLPPSPLAVYSDF